MSGEPGEEGVEVEDNVVEEEEDEDDEEELVVRGVILVEL